MVKVWHALVGGLATVGALGVGGWHLVTHWAPSTERYKLQGVDLGEDAAVPEWPTIRGRGADFAYLVATSGTDRRAPNFETNWQALPDAGMRRGAVHLYSLCQRAEDQANAFNTVVPRTGDALPAAVDLSFREDCAARPERTALIAELRRFLTIVETHTGKPALLRIAKPVERQYTLTAALARPVWATGNFFTPAYPAHPWQMWRATDIRRVDGIEGPVNWDVVAP